MPTSINWEGHNIDFSTRLTPKYLFLSTETIVKVDGKEISHSGGFAFTENAIGQIKHLDKNVQIDVETRSGLVSPHYLIRVDGKVIAQGKHTIDNFAFGCFIWVLFFALVWYIFIRLL